MPLQSQCSGVIDAAGPHVGLLFSAGEGTKCEVPPLSKILYRCTRLMLLYARRVASETGFGRQSVVSW